jgi:hypothetical protein
MDAVKNASDEQASKLAVAIPEAFANLAGKYIACSVGKSAYTRGWLEEAAASQYLQAAEFGHGTIPSDIIQDWLVEGHHAAKDAIRDYQNSGYYVAPLIKNVKDTLDDIENDERTFARRGRSVTREAEWHIICLQVVVFKWQAPPTAPQQRRPPTPYRLSRFDAYCDNLTQLRRKARAVIGARTFRFSRGSLAEETRLSAAAPRIAQARRFLRGLAAWHR